RSSQKVYIPGELHKGIKVPMRAISLDDSVDHFNNSRTPNEPVLVYDTSGPYTDPSQEIDIHSGLTPIRQSWIAAREDVQLLGGLSSEYGRERAENEKLDSLRFQNIRKPLKAKPGKNVTQLHYDRIGIITHDIVIYAIR